MQETAQAISQISPGFNGGRRTFQKKVADGENGAAHHAVPVIFPTRRGKSRLNALYLVALGLAVLMVGGTVLLLPRRDAVSAYQPLPEPIPSAAIVNPAVAEPAPEAVTAVPLPPSIPQATVTVPDLGLRNSHSFDAKVTRVKVRRGEKVGVVAKHTPVSGPSWVQIRTRSGATGWVIASAVAQRN